MPAPENAADAFARARGALAGVQLRPAVRVETIPAPTRLAPYAHALSGDVVGRDGADAGPATGHFVVLHDPDAPEPWEGAWRVVGHARARVDAAHAGDPLLAQIGWTWLREALARRGAGHRALGGTVTRVTDERFGSLAGEPTTVDLELRASWTPLGRPEDLGAHLTAWADLLAELAGGPPLPDGVTAFPRMG